MTKDHEQKIVWMAFWAAKHGAVVEFEGECGFGRECVGLLVNGMYADYEWYDDDYKRIDNNGEVWTPPNAYHKHPCVAVLGRGEEAESQLYDWLRWFDDNHFVVESGTQEMDPSLGLMGILLCKHLYCRMVRK